MTDLDNLLARPDFVSLHARVTPETVDFFNAKKFGMMKEGAVFINTAREILVDEQALYKALVSKHLAGAALDVLKPWPADTPGPLVSLPNVIITPHIGGAHPDAPLGGGKILAPQISRFLAG